MGKAYSIGKGLERPLEKALENFKIGQPAAISKNQEIQIPVQGNSVSDKPANVPVIELVESGFLEKVLVQVASATTTDEGLVELRKKAGEEKELAEGLARALNTIREEIRKVEDDSLLRESSVGRLKISALRKTEGEIQEKLRANETLKGHVDFGQLLDEIRGIRPENTGEVHGTLTKVIQLGRYRLATPVEVEEGKRTKWPSGTIFFEGRVYYSVHEGMASAGQRALEAELRKLVDSAKLSKAAAMKSRGNADITGLTCERPRPGSYYLYSPKREVPQEAGPPLKFSEGHLLVELVDKNKGRKDRPPYLVVEIKQGEGSCRSLADRSQGRTDVPYYWVELGFIIPPKDRETGKPRRLDDDEFRRALKIIKTIRAICAVSGKPFPEQKKPETSVAEKPAEMPAPALTLKQVFEKLAATTSESVPLTAEETAEKLVDAVIPPAPEPATEKSEKKVKKGKK